MKANLLCAKGGLPQDVEVLPYDDEYDLVSVVTVGLRPDARGELDFSIYRSLELRCPYYLELGNGDKEEIVFTRVRYLEGPKQQKTLRVSFKVERHTGQGNTK